MMNQSGIYEIVNTVNGKRYIGSAKNFKTRWSRHLSALRLQKHHSRHLQSAWNKYGEAAFKFLPMLVCQHSMLLFYEQQLLDKMKPEYNIAPTAGNTMGIPCSTEKRAKIAAAHKGKTLSTEHKAAIAAGGVGRKPSEETRQKLRAAQRARAEKDPARWAELAEQSAERQRNRVWTPEQRENARVAKLGSKPKVSPEGRARRREALVAYNKSRVVSEETRAKMAAAKKGKPAHPNTVAAQKERMKGNSYRAGMKWTPEMREKILASRAATLAKKKAAA